MKLLGTKIPLKDLEEIYNEFAKKMEQVVASNEVKPSKTKK